MADTKQKLMTAALETISTEGLAAASARAIAAKAGVNQALIFYHFAGVTDLIAAATRQSVDAGVASYREEFNGVTSLSDLLRVGRDLHTREQGRGNVALMAQLMAGAHHDDVIAAAAGHAMKAWSSEIAVVVRRTLEGSAVDGVVDVDGLAHAVSAAFIGLELYDGADHDGAAQALDALEQLGHLVEVVDGLGPVASKALRATARRAADKRRS